jgi:hypothetical protein
MKLALFFAVAASAWAQADLTGVWSNATPTPLERPKELGGREFYTAAEMAENAKKAQEPGAADVLAGTGAHYNFEQYGLDPNQAKLTLTQRTSIVVDPKDGRIPPLNEAGRKRAAARAEARKGKGPFDGPETRPLSERCIVWPSTGPPMLQGPYNNNIQIEQGPGYVVIVEEMNHDARVIPLDGRPHPGPKIRAYMGDSRGHWEGKTLVVDTTNYSEKLNFRGSSENLHVVERFTRTNEDSILYQFTVEDPQTWDRPWSGELTLGKTQGPVFEFACHEGNYGMANTLRGARAEEARASAEKARKEESK